MAVALLISSTNCLRYNGTGSAQPSTASGGRTASRSCGPEQLMKLHLDYVRLLLSGISYLCPPNRLLVCLLLNSFVVYPSLQTDSHLVLFSYLFVVYLFIFFRVLVSCCTAHGLRFTFCAHLYAHMHTFTYACTQGECLD